MTTDTAHEFTEGPRQEGFPFLAVCDYVIVIPDPEHERSTGGIILPQSDARRSWSGTVAAVGPGLHLKKDGTRIPVDTKLGTRVAYDLRSFVAIEHMVGDVEVVYHVVRDDACWMSYDDPESKVRIVKPIADAEGVIYR